MGKYAKIFSLSFFENLRNYKSLMGLGIFLIACLLIFDQLWRVAAIKIGALDLLPNELFWYIALNEWVLVSFPPVHDNMEEDLRSGRIAYLLPRPLSYLSATFFESLGVLIGNLAVLGVVCFGFAYLRMGGAPFSLAAFFFLIPLGVLASVVALIFQMIVGISAFWVDQVSPFYWIFEKLLFVLGGLILPLMIYPKWLQTIAHLTPFPAILGDRSSLAIDFQPASAFLVIESLLIWGVFGLCLLIFLYRRGLYKLNIAGG